MDKFYELSFMNKFYELSFAATFFSKNVIPFEMLIETAANDML